MNLQISEEERQGSILALAELALERPGWEPAFLRPLVEKYGGENALAMFEEFKKIHKQRIAPIDITEPISRRMSVLVRDLVKASEEVLLNTGVDQYPAPKRSLEKLREALDKIQTAYHYGPDYTPGEKGSGQPIGRTEDPIPETHSKNDLLPGPGKE